MFLINSIIMSDGEGQTVDNAWSLKIPAFKAEHNPHGLVEESSFATPFLKLRENYLREVWPLVQQCLEEHHLKAELDLIEGSMVVKTTRKTFDPYIIIKSRDMMKLMKGIVPFEQAKRVLEDGIGCDIIKIDIGLEWSEFLKRRKRLFGATLKWIKLLTECYVLVQWNTVTAMGPYKGLQLVREIVVETMNNVPPNYIIRGLMVKLMKDLKVPNEDWSRFFSNFQDTADTSN